MTATNDVSVEYSIKQVLDGSHYKGHMKITDIKFDFELMFEIPIPRLRSVSPMKSKTELRRFFPITVKRDDADIELTDEEYFCFFSILVPLTIGFYNSPQTRATNGGLLGQMGDSLTSLGASVSVGVNGSCTYKFSKEFCEILSAPKFGCALVV